MISKKIKLLRELLIEKNLDGYIVPKNDIFFSEYPNIDRLKKITNFNGSAGLALILKKKNYLFVDGRYTTQAKIQSGKNYNILEIPNFYPFNVLGKIEETLNIGYDPKLFTNFYLNKLFKNYHNLVPIFENLIDKIFKRETNSYQRPFFSLNLKASGESSLSKIRRLKEMLKKSRIKNIFISAPENVAWLLNIRGFDSPNSPIPNCQLILNNRRVYFFSDKEKINKIKKIDRLKNIKYCEFENFDSIINKLSGKYFCIDKNTCSIFNETIIRSKFNIKLYEDPCYLLKSVKNKIEIRNMEKAHISDGVALTKFIYFIKQKKNLNISELEVVNKLEKFRKKQKNYLYPSFDTIAGAGSNGAIIHYKATKKTDKKIKKNDILLLDSGGQYKYGTTDVTRTISFGKQSNRMKNIFTRVLKGHIGVVLSNINKLKTGNKIDFIARKWLKKINLNYKHGTGHGVGCFLNVHEGPQAISSSNKILLRKGMILSNEPGYYQVNKFGIRIENLVFIKEKNKKLFFKNLTMAPIDKDLINEHLLSKNEKKYLFNYHLEVYNKISKYLNLKEKNWLANLI